MRRKTREPRGATATYRCECCREPFVARTADRARGWARFCSKRCKASKQAAAPRAEPAPRPLARREDIQAAEAMAARMFGWTPATGARS